MIAGIGIDLVDLDHMAAVVKNSPRIVARILTKEELALYEARSDKRKLEFLAGRFAAKEAFSKAMGTGIGKVVSFQNVVVLNDAKGCPYVAESPFDGNVFVSITHSQKMAAAQVVLERQEV